MTTWLVPILAAAVGALGALSAALLTQRHQRDRDQRLARMASEETQQALVNRYQEPLVRAAYDLQSRLYNIVELNGLGAPTGLSGPAYMSTSTAWLFGQFFGWREIVRREAQFLVAPERDDEESLGGRLDDVAAVCSSDKARYGNSFLILRSEQRALGEVMVVYVRTSAGHARSDCKGYGRFCSEMADRDSDLSLWFRPLVEEVLRLAAEPDGAPRLRHLQRALIGVVELVDEAAIRYPRNRSLLEVDVEPGR